MSIYTIVDALGEIVTVVDVPDEAHLAANTPAGCTSVPGPPDFAEAYFLDGTWVEKPPKPAHATWDAASKSWVDARTISAAREQKTIELNWSRDAADRGGVAFMEGRFPTDDAAYVKYLTWRTESLAGQWPGVQIAQTLDGSLVELTEQQFSLLFAVVAAMRRDNANRLNLQLAAVNDPAATLLQINAISW